MSYGDEDYHHGYHCQCSDCVAQAEAYSPPIPRLGPLRWLVCDECRQEVNTGRNHLDCHWCTKCRKGTSHTYKHDGRIVRYKDGTPVDGVEA